MNDGPVCATGGYVPFSGGFYIAPAAYFFLPEMSMIMNDARIVASTVINMTS